MGDGRQGEGERAGGGMRAGGSTGEGRGDKGRQWWANSVMFKSKSGQMICITFQQSGMEMAL